MWTDSALVVRGIKKILCGMPHGMKVHSDLWGRIQSGIVATGKKQIAVKRSRDT